MNDLVLAEDEHGFPVMLEATKSAPTVSGNDAHGVSTGRFGAKPGKKDAQKESKSTVSSSTVPPGGLDPSEWSRRMDAVREAAREFESYSEQDLTEWLRGRTNRQLTEGQISAFLADVRAQQVSDLVDILDNSERGVLRGRRFVRVRAPQGYTRKALNSLRDDELRSIAERLRARGWNDKQVQGLAKRLPEARRAVISAEPVPVSSAEDSIPIRSSQ